MTLFAIWVPLFILLLTFILLNILAFNHARAMTCYVAKGTKEPPVEQMSFADRLKVILSGFTVFRPEIKTMPSQHGLEYEPHSLQNKSGSRLSAWLIKAQTAKGMVIMFPPFGFAKDSLLPEAKEFTSRGYSVFMVDFTGAGESEGNQTSIGYYESADVLASLEYCTRSFPGNRLILYGISLGAAAILKSVTEGAWPDGVILECPFDSLMGTVKNRIASMGMPAFPCAHLLVFWGGIQLGYDGFSHRPVDYASRLQCPALFLHGEDDQRVLATQARQIFDNTKSENKKIVTFKGTGHGEIYTSNPDLWNREVFYFLEQI